MLLPLICGNGKNWVKTHVPFPLHSSSQEAKSHTPVESFLMKSIVMINITNHVFDWTDLSYSVCSFKLFIRWTKTKEGKLVKRRETDTLLQIKIKKFGECICIQPLLLWHPWKLEWNKQTALPHSATFLLLLLSKLHYLLLLQRLVLCFLSVFQFFLSIEATSGLMFCWMGFLPGGDDEIPTQN